MSLAGMEEIGWRDASDAVARGTTCLVLGVGPGDLYHEIDDKGLCARDSREESEFGVVPMGS